MDTLEITIQHRRGDHWPMVALHTHGSELPARGEGQLAFDPDHQTQLTALRLEPRAYGALLGKALFQDTLRDLFIAARSAVDSAGLRVLLVVEDPDLKPLRWERLCAPNRRGGWDFLLLDQRTPFSRYLPSLTDRRFPAIGRRDLRALVVLADPSPGNPYGLAPFDAADCAKRIATALGEIPRDLLGPLPGALGPASLDALVERLTGGPYTLLHLVSHGQVVADGETVVYLLDSAGQVAPVTATDLIGRLGRLGAGRGLPHFAFLATCEGARPQAEDALGGLAQRLVRELGIPAVVAMTERVSIATAADLTAAFYTRLRAHGEPDLALVQARAGLHDRADGLVPALFSRLGGRPLFSDRLDRPLTPAEIAYGLDRLAHLVPQRAPILGDEFQRQAAALRAGLGSDPAALSEAALKERTAALDAIDALSQEVVDLSLPALALDQEVPTADDRCPFPGLKAFETEEEPFFFGRAPLIHKLSDRLRAKRLIAILGASGTGKSSLVLAGLIPAFVRTHIGSTAPRRDPTQPPETGPSRVRYLTPGADPETALARQLASLQPTDGDGLLIVDQLEELFTLCTDHARRARFVHQFISAWQTNPRLHLILTLRADFWGDCAPYPDLKDLIQAHQELIAPMTTAELRAAMEQQAAAVGLRFEADLSHQILAEVEGEPGAMPLLQHLLLHLWRRRHGRWLRAAEYRALGGIRQAIAHTADAIYIDLKADPAAQAMVRNLFVRLTRLDEDDGRPEPYRDTRHRVALPDLIPIGADADQVRALVQRLADARLVVTTPDASSGQTQVEVSHEALIRHWPRLRTWLDEDRASWILLAAVRDQARNWQANREREADLPRWGERLQHAQTLLGQERFAPTAGEQRFLDSAKALAERERAEREEQQRQRVEALERAAQEQQRRARIAWMAVAVTVVLLAVVLYFAHRMDAEKRHAQASAREASYQTANIFWNSAVAERDRDPLKAAHSFARAAEGFAKVDSLKESANARVAIKFIVDRHLLLGAVGEMGGFGGAVFAADETRVLTWNRDSAQLWNVLTGEALTPPLKHDNSVASGRFSPDGTRILTTSDDDTARLWDASTGAPLVPSLAHDGPVWGAHFSTNGASFITWGKDGPARLWDARTGAALAPPLKHDKSVNGARFSADGTRVLTWSDDGTARLWDARSGAALTPPLKHDEPVRGAQFSIDGTRVLSWGGDDARLWDALTGAVLTPPLKHSGAVQGAQLVQGAQFSRDETQVLTWGDDSTARLWDAHTGAALTPPLNHRNLVTGAQFNAASTRVLT